jgi:Flp pilus assembly protein TadD
MQKKLSIRRWIAVAAAGAVLFGVVGCAGTKTKTQRAEATEQWNAARASVMFGLARDQYQSGNYDKCRQTLAEAMRLQPTNAKLHVLAGKLAIEQGQLESAERSLAKARELDPKDAEADYLSGAVCQRWQKAQAAFEFYSAASTKAPNELPYVLAKAEMLVVMDRSNEALALLSDKVLFFEHSAVIRDAAGQLLLQQKRYPEAVEMLRQASILATDDQSIREHLTMAMFYNKQYREACEQFARLMKDPKNQLRPEMYLAQGECLMQLHKPAEARGCFESAAQLSPSNGQAMTSLAKAALELNDLRRADLALRKAVALDPQSSEVQLLVGYLRVRENKMSDALTAFKRASELDRTDTTSLCMIGYVMEKTGHANQAMQYYSQALKMKPNDEMAKQMMATVDVNE